MPDQPPSIDYLAHIRSESARFAEVLAVADPSAPVPSCPDWEADDLLWHLAEVQWFWGSIVQDLVTDPAEADALTTSRPEGREALRTFFAAASSELAAALASHGDDVPAWTWSSDQTVGFIRRRQAHEALIHRVDAELTAGSRTPLDRDLCADGVDEVLRVMYGGTVPWGTFTPHEGRTVRVTTTDTGDSWFLTLGRFTGTDPEGEAHDEPDLSVLPAALDTGQAAAAEISGTAADLDCWFWHRPAEGGVSRTGAGDVQDALDAMIAPGIN